MGRERNMPSRKRIFEHWNGINDNLKNDNTCFKCGITSDNYTIVERAHILSVAEGGSDEVGNIHLLCNSCHKESEFFNGEMYDLWLGYKGRLDELLACLIHKNILKELSMDKQWIDMVSEIWNTYCDVHGDWESGNHLLNTKKKIEAKGLWF